MKRKPRCRAITRQNQTRCHRIALKHTDGFCRGHYFTAAYDVLPRSVTKAPLEEQWSNDATYNWRDYK